jgi:hypothetical protein
MFPLSIPQAVSIFVALVGVTTAISVITAPNDALLAPDPPPLRDLKVWNHFWGIGPVIPPFPLPPLLDVNSKGIVNVKGNDE